MKPLLSVFMHQILENMIY